MCKFTGSFVTSGKWQRDSVSLAFVSTIFRRFLNLAIEAYIWKKGKNWSVKLYQCQNFHCQILTKEVFIDSQKVRALIAGVLLSRDTKWNQVFLRSVNLVSSLGSLHYLSTKPCVHAWNPGSLLIFPMFAGEVAIQFWFKRKRFGIFPSIFFISSPQSQSVFTCHLTAKQQIRHQDLIYIFHA